MSRLVSNLRELIYEKGLLNLSDLAKKIGISRTTLYALHDDSWKQIQRDTIEKVCDYFGCEISSLFKIEEDPFWMPFKRKGSFYFIIGGTLERKEVKPVLGFWDIKVMNEITSFLYQLPKKDKLEFRIMTSLDFGENINNIIDFVKKHNTIIIGSPKINRITEIIMAKLYGAEPFNPDHENRKKIPFRFARPENWGISKAKSAVAEIITDHNHKERGVFSERDGRVVARNEWIDNFFDTSVESANDCGILRSGSNGPDFCFSFSLLGVDFPGANFCYYFKINDISPTK
ncbi:MAG: helix-turn-helix domain-containing protein [Candidatus Hodarchaeota archaeon]